jgi:trigger factor
MQVSVETTQGLERRFVITIPGNDIRQELQKRLIPLTKTVRIAGFRPGKVPLSLIEKRFGDQVRQEVVEELVKSSVTKALDENQARMVDNPVVESLSEEKSPEGDLRFAVSFEVYPEINLSPLEEIVIKRAEVLIDEADVDKMIENLRRQHRTWLPVDGRPAMLGDRIKADFTGTFADGTTFPGNKGDDVFIILGDGTFIPGFEQGLLGATAGETRTIEVTFPQNYHSPEVAGKLARFTVTVKSLENGQMPEVNEAFVQSCGVKEGTVEGLQEAVRATMKRDFEGRSWLLVKEQIRTELYKNNPIELPRSLVEGELAQLRAEVSGNEPPGLEEQARRRVALGLLIGDIARRQQLTVDRDRVRAYIRSLAEDYEKPEEVESFYLSDNNRLQEVEAVVLEDVVMEWLLGQVQVNTTPVPFSTLINSPPPRQSGGEEVAQP